MNKPKDSVLLTCDGSLPLGYYPEAELVEYAPAAPLMARIEALEAALECALALCATPIARRRLGIDPNTNEMLRTARAALAKEPTE